MYLSLGQWQIRETPRPHRSGPPQALSGIDLSSATRNLGLFVSAVPLGGDVDVTLNSSHDDPRDMQVNAQILAAMQALAGYLPPGNITVAQAILDLLRHGDPEGISYWKPLIPEENGQQVLAVPGMGRIAVAPFRWGVSHDTVAIQAVVQTTIQRDLDHVDAGKRTHAAVQQLVSTLQRKYGVSDWRQFVAPRDRGRFGQPAIPHTSFTDNFNRSGGLNGSTASGGGLWSVTGGPDWSTNGTQVESPMTAENDIVILQSDVSSVDHFVECTTVEFVAGGISVGECARCASDGLTLYLGEHPNGTPGSFWKQIAGSWTNLGGNLTAQTTGVFRLKVNGSTLTASFQGTTTGEITDTSIAGGTKGGMYAFNTLLRSDDFVVSDLTPSSGASSLLAGRLVL